MACEHKRGDMIHGMWVCADCFQPLHSRPTRYGMVRCDTKVPDGTRQEIIWMAEKAVNSDGVPFGKFVLWMVIYLRCRSLWAISKDSARQQCLEILRDMGEPYGSESACWSRDDAKELVREGIVAYWDEGPCGANT